MEKIIQKHKTNSKHTSTALGTKYPGIYLSAQESQIAILSLEGESPSDIGKLLNLSLRTIEYYLYKMRLKLNCINAVELCQKLRDSDFLKNTLRDST